MSSPSSKPTVGFVGLGAMGFGMATNLVKHGYKVRGYDVFPASIERFVAAGGTAAFSLADSASLCSHYIVMVATAAQAQPALFSSDGIVQALPKGATLYLCSTVPSSYAQSVAEELKKAGREDIFLIDCPVSGGAKRAADGTLSIMAGARDEAIEKGRDVLEVMADPKKLYIVKGGVGGGSNLKMVHQVLAGIQILSASESMGLATWMGLDRKMVRDEVVKSGGWSWMFENRSERMLDEDYFPGVSALTIILKDVGIITSTARAQSFPIPLSSTAEQVYLSALSRGFGRDDDAGIVRMYFPDKPSVKSPPTPEETTLRIDLIIKLLKGIHVCAAAEAIAFTKYLGLDLEQFYELTKDAAGGSKEFQGPGWEMIKLLQEQSDEEDGVASLIVEHVKALSEVLAEARRLDCPLYLGAEALNLCLMATKNNKEARVSVLPRMWI